MKDCKGKDIAVGDFVAYVRGKNRDACIDTGYITKIYTNKGIDECSVGSHTHVKRGRVMKLKEGVFDD